MNDIFKKSVENNLSKLSKCKLDILIFQRKNEELCEQNNSKIAYLQEEIQALEKNLEEDLRKSKERKIETTSGWVAFRVMPDQWEYDEPTIITWCKKNDLPFYHNIEVLEKLKLKNAIQNQNIYLKEFKDIPGLKVTPQEPKFNYKVNPY